jgi:hypothetical protein
MDSVFVEEILPYFAKIKTLLSSILKVSSFCFSHLGHYSPWDFSRVQLKVRI